MKESYSKRIIIARIALFLFTQILLTAFGILLLSSILFFFGSGQHVLVFPVSFIIGFFASLLLHKRLIKNYPVISTIVLLMFTLIIYVPLCFLAQRFYDLSWDGQEYHQEIMVQITDKKWNPISSNLPEGVEEYMEPWVKHYPKASELLSSSVISFSNSLESGKVFNLLFISASFLLVLAIILEYSSVNVFVSFLLAVAIAFNPVSIYQSFSYYLDGQLSSLAVILVSLVYLILQKDNSKYLLVWIGVLIIMINLKFTGVAFAGLGCLCLLTFCLLLKKRKLFRSTFLFSLFGAVIAFCVVGFHPYVQNTLEMGHPFYPLAGKNSINITQSYVPENLKDMGRIKRFVYSHLSLEETQFVVPLRIPFLPNPVGVFPRTWGDARVFGEGLFFMEISIIAFILFIVQLVTRRKSNLYLIIALLYLVVGVLVVPDNWWARYVPFLYIIPWLVLMYSYFSNKKASFLTQLLLSVMLLNSFVEISLYVKPQFQGTTQINSILTEAEESSFPVRVCSSTGFFTNNINRFEENKIDYKVITDPTECQELIPNSYRFPNSDIYINIIDQYLYD